MPYNRRRPLLSSTRPPRIHSKATSSKNLSSHITRTLIRTHHHLQKCLSAALSAGHTELAASLQAKIAAHGGLALYQRASLLGQSVERGGDSGRVLKEWVEELLSPPEDIKSRNSREKKGENASQRRGKIKMLEVGALKVENVCSRSSLFAVERIDLHSQHASIKTQDFMQRPLPSSADEYFDIVNLSLVLNYLGTPIARGNMLRRAEKFLRRPPNPQVPTKGGFEGAVEEEESPNPEEATDPKTVLVPSCFLVLPAPCVTNSRYLDEERLEAMMGSIGYMRVRRKMSVKLVYYLFRLSQKPVASTNTKGDFGKKEIRKGAKRNNFTILF